MNAVLQSLLTAIIKNKANITLLFWAVWLSSVIVLMGGVGLAFMDKAWLMVLYEMGKLFAQGAILFYFASLYPGILKRAEWFVPIRVAASLFKRHFGVTMFLFAINHFMFITLLPALVYGFIPSLSGHALLGFIALILLFPLWVTSNNWSQMKLGKMWKMLHRLTYLILFVIFFHVALQQSKWLFPVLITMILEAYSWLVAWQRKSSQNQVTPNA